MSKPSSLIDSLEARVWESPWETFQEYRRMDVLALCKAARTAYEALDPIQHKQILNDINKMLGIVKD